MAMHARGKEPIPYSRAVVAVCLLLVVAFTAVQLWFMWNRIPLNDAQTYCFYACFGMEFASLAFIKGRKLKYTEGNGAAKSMPHIAVNDEEDEDGGKVPK